MEPHKSTDNPTRLRYNFNWKFQTFPSRNVNPQIICCLAQFTFPIPEKQTGLFLHLNPTLTLCASQLKWIPSADPNLPGTNFRGTSAHLCGIIVALVKGVEGQRWWPFKIRQRLLVYVYKYWRLLKIISQFFRDPAQDRGPRWWCRALKYTWTVECVNHVTVWTVGSETNHIKSFKR